MNKDYNKVENTNEVLKLDGNQLTTQNFFVGQIKKMFASQNVPLSDYQIKIGNNAVAKMIQMAQSNNKDIMEYPQGQTLFTLQNIISNEWDVLQGEGVIIFQNKAEIVDATDKNGNVLKDAKGKVITKKVWSKFFDLRPNKNGHVKSVRMYAAGTNKANPITLSYVVYEGDDFTDIEYVGVEIKPPVFRPKRLSNKVTHVVYALNMIDGTIQYVVGHREQVKPSLIAQAKNNGVPDKDLDRMNALKTVDEILAEYENKTFVAENWKGEKEEKPYFNDTWIQGYNREQMLETKLRGVIANRMIEKEFNNEFQKRAFEHVIVEKPREQLNQQNDRGENLIEQSKGMIEESTASKQDFKTDPRMKKTLKVVKETTGEVIEAEVVETKVVETSPKEVVVEDVAEVEEEVIVTETIVNDSGDNDEQAEGIFADGDFGQGFGL